MEFGSRPLFRFALGLGGKRTPPALAATAFTRTSTKTTPSFARKVLSPLAPAAAGLGEPRLPGQKGALAAAAVQTGLMPTSCDGLAVTIARATPVQDCGAAQAIEPETTSSSI